MDSIFLEDIIMDLNNHIFSCLIFLIMMCLNIFFWNLFLLQKETIFFSFFSSGQNVFRFFKEKV